jgi:hypothetical protein
MDEPRHPSAYPPYQQSYELPVREPAKPERGRPPAQYLSRGANDKNNMHSEFTLGLPTPISSSSSVSAESPYFDGRALLPSVYTLRMQENSLETLDDPDNRAAPNTLIKSSGGIHSVSNENNVDTSPFATYSMPPIGAQNAHRSQSPMDGFAGDRACNNPSRSTSSQSSASPSRSTSSQSSASHSTSDSDLAQVNPSSRPIGVARRSHNPASSSGYRKNKMYQCSICYKFFPRPSGLATHMNSHSSAKRSLITIDIVYCTY